MDKIKAYLSKNFEQTFVLLVLLSVVGIYYFAPFKLAFLNFFFIPILMAGYYLGIRYAVLGAFLCIVLVSAYVAFDPQPFLYVPEKQDIYLQISLWGGFLILSGALVGRLYEILDARVEKEKSLNQAYQSSQEELEKANAKLKNYAKNLKSMVEEKTQHLSDSKRVVEQLKNQVEEVLHSSMDPTVAQMLIEKRLRTEKKNISVLVADLHQFTPYVENRRPEAVIHELNKYLKDMSVFMDAYSAHLDKYTGDGYMLEFGAPIDYKYHALQAVVCGIRMRDFMHHSTYPWPMRLGITSGNAVVGMIGGRRQAYTAMGNCANTASRLESLCPPGSLLIDEETYQQTKHFIKVREFCNDETQRDGRRSNVESDIQLLQQQLTQQPKNVELMVQLANKLLQHGEAEQAKDWFAKAMHLKPDLDDVKIGYAEASMQVSQHHIRLKGRSDAVMLYEVVGLRDFLLSPAIPARLRQEFGHIIEQNSIPSELIWPTEIISGQLGHAARTSLLSYALADKLNVGERERQALLTASFLHNCGHQIVPHSVLTKTAALTKEDIQSIQLHPEESVRVMIQHGYDDAMAIECVRNCNTGSSAPISQIARILSIAEVYEALTDFRPWRDRWLPQSALEEMRVDVRNGKFDAKTFDAFEEMILSGLNDA